MIRSRSHRPLRRRLTALHLVLLATALIVPAALSPPATAQDEGAGQADPVLSVYRADWESVTGKLVSLAEAIPEDAYDWRPSEGVRSVGEVVVHVAGPNLFLTRPFLGEMEGDDPLEALGEEPSKQERIDALEASIARVNQLLDEVGPAELSESYEAFGRQMSGYRILHIIVSHSHEHLGQLIAYGRANDVTPPWSE